MDMQQIKLHLRDNPELIEDILNKIDCHHIKIIPNKRVQSALPYPSDNPTSVQILLNDALNTKVYTKNEFDKYEIKDIFTLIQYIKKCSLPEAIQIVCDVCNIQYEANPKQLISESYTFLKKYKRSIKKEEILENEIVLDESFSQRFIRVDCSMYLDDGVSSETQEKFGVSYDVLENRVVFPIRNDIGQLLSFKGRTCEQDYKDKDIPKFISYYPCNNNYYLFGLYENYYDILLADELIIVEAEKGVMQSDSMGINNVIATNKKSISSIQLKKILKLGKKVILAFDKDVTLEEIFIECRKFNNLCDVDYIYDTLNLLKNKESPVDRGRKIFDQLYEECRFTYKGE